MIDIHENTNVTRRRRKRKRKTILTGSFRMQYMSPLPVKENLPTQPTHGIDTIENHCTRTAQSFRGGCSRRVHKIMNLVAKKANILINILLLKIFIRNYCHLHIQLCISLTHLCGLCDSRYSARVMPKCVFFFLKKGEERNVCCCSAIYAYFS